MRLQRACEWVCRWVCCWVWFVAAWAVLGSNRLTPTLVSEAIFAPEARHNHASCVVEAPDGTLLVAWFNGSGERQADDVKLQASRRRQGARS